MLQAPLGPWFPASTTTLHSLRIARHSDSVIAQYYVNKFLSIFLLAVSYLINLFLEFFEFFVDMGKFDLF